VSDTNTTQLVEKDLGAIGVNCSHYSRSSSIHPHCDLVVARLVCPFFQRVWTRGRKTNRQVLVKARIICNDALGATKGQNMDTALNLALKATGRNHPHPPREESNNQGRLVAGYPLRIAGRGWEGKTRFKEVNMSSRVWTCQKCEGKVRSRRSRW
jgi:hypothetical protein